MRNCSTGDCDRTATSTGRAFNEPSRCGGQATSLASLAAERRDAEGELLSLESSLLDAMTQVLASIVMERGKTFILRSIEQVAMTDGEFPESLWAHAVLQREDDDKRQSFVGTVRVVDQSGRACVELSGLSLAFLERSDAPEKAAHTTFVVASHRSGRGAGNCLQHARRDAACRLDGRSRRENRPVGEAAIARHLTTR